MAYFIVWCTYMWTQRVADLISAWGGAGRRSLGVLPCSTPGAGAWTVPEQKPTGSLAQGR